MVETGGAGPALGRDETQEQGLQCQGERPGLSEGAGERHETALLCWLGSPRATPSQPAQAEGVTLGGPVPVRQIVKKRIINKPIVAKARPESKLIFTQQLEA